ncbi:MAG: hypothetical protein H7A36_04490 [Chlamydiales bacterium]|nr:hypothetical protein [Chlamydiales bacterium]
MGITPSQRYSQQSERFSRAAAWTLAAFSITALFFVCTTWLKGCTWHDKPAFVSISKATAASLGITAFVFAEFADYYKAKASTPEGPIGWMWLLPFNSPGISAHI